MLHPILNKPCQSVDGTGMVWVGRQDNSRTMLMRASGSLSVNICQNSRCHSPVDVYFYASTLALAGSEFIDQLKNCQFINKQHCTLIL